MNPLCVLDVLLPPLIASSISETEASIRQHFSQKDTATAATGAGASATSLEDFFNGGVKHESSDKGELPLPICHSWFQAGIVTIGCQL